MTEEQRRAANLTSQKKWRDRNMEKIRERWRIKAREKKGAAALAGNGALEAMLKRKANYDRGYRKREHEKRRMWNDKYVARKAGDPHYHIARRARARIRMAVVNSCQGFKSAKSIELLGCSIEFLKTHIEGQFTNGMTWEMFIQGKIHLDHYVPCAYFSLVEPFEQRACFNWRNLRPMYAVPNCAKGAKLIAPQSFIDWLYESVRGDSSTSFS